jgi:hypothetical protein
MDTQVLAIGQLTIAEVDRGCGAKIKPDCMIGWRVRLAE